MYKYGGEVEFSEQYSVCKIMQTDDKTSCYQDNKKSASAHEALPHQIREGQIVALPAFHPTLRQDQTAQ